jgi:hypothetical protein
MKKTIFFGVAGLLCLAVLGGCSVGVDDANSRILDSKKGVEEPAIEEPVIEEPVFMPGSITVKFLPYDTKLEYNKASYMWSNYVGRRIFIEDFDWDNIQELKFPADTVIDSRSIRIFISRWEWIFPGLKPDTDLDEWLVENDWREYPVGDELRELEVRYRAEWEGYLDYLKTLEFVKSASWVCERGFRQTPHHVTEGYWADEYIRIVVKEEYLDKLYAEEFKLADFKYSDIIEGLGYSEIIERFNNSTLEMTVVLKEGGLGNAEAAAKYFNSLDFIEWATVDY